MGYKEEVFDMREILKLVRDSEEECEKLCLGRTDLKDPEFIERCTDILDQKIKSLCQSSFEKVYIDVNHLLKLKKCTEKNPISVRNNSREMFIAYLRKDSDELFNVKRDIKYQVYIDEDLEFRICEEVISDYEIYVKLHESDTSMKWVFNG